MLSQSKDVLNAMVLTIKKRIVEVNMRCVLCALEIKSEWNVSKQIDEIKCINCVDTVNKLKLDIHHPAWSYECPVYPPRAWGIIGETFCFCI